MSESKELTLPERAAVALGTPKYEQEIRDLVAKTVTITEVKNKDGREQCHGAMMTLKNTRVAIEKAAKTAREDATAFSKAVIAEEKRLVALAEPEEARLQGLRDQWDEAVAAEKAAKAAAEKARVDGIRKMIDEIKAVPAESVGRSSVALAATIELMEMHEITLEAHQEFSGEAEMAKIATVAKLKEMLTAQVAVEQAAIEAARQAEADRIERERVAEANRIEAKRLADLAAEIERQAQEARAKQEEADRIAREQREEAERKERAALAEIARRDEQMRNALAEERRLQQEAADKLAAATSEIQGIQQQVIIATQGRLGVRKGGTIECLRDTLAETEAWDIDLERFGILAGAAESAKTTAVAEIRRLLAEAEARVVAEAEAQAKREAEEAEAARIAQAEADRVFAEEEAQRVAAEAAEAEHLRRERVQFENNGPGDVEIVKTLAAHYEVTIGEAMEWLKKFDYAAADEHFAAANVAANRLEKAA